MATGARRLVAQSFTGWTNETDGPPVREETTPLAASERTVLTDGSLLVGRTVAAGASRSGKRACGAGNTMRSEAGKTPPDHRDLAVREPCSTRSQGTNLR